MNMDSAALLALAERCEAATGKLYPNGFCELDDDIYRTVAGNEPFNSATSPRYTASLDAAMTLVDPLWFWRVGNDGEGADPSLYRADIGHTQKAPAFIGFARSVAATPALALCATALRARAATLTSEQVSK